MPTSPEYIIKADQEKRGQFVYSCTACNNILGVRKELETPDCIVDLLSGICPSCGAKLENSVDCRQGQVPEGWHNPIPSIDRTKVRRRRAAIAACFILQPLLAGFLALRQAPAASRP